MLMYDGPKTMERQLKLLKFEFYHRMAEILPVPVKAYGLCDEDNRDVILVYEEELEVAA